MYLLGKITLSVWFIIILIITILYHIIGKDKIKGVRRSWGNKGFSQKWPLSELVDTLLFRDSTNPVDI